MTGKAVSVGGGEVAPGGIVVTQEYTKVRHLLESGCPLVFLTGGAGTGKTTLIRYLRGALDKKMAVVAPTGVAALNVGGATIHSFFRLPPKIHEEEDIKLVHGRKLYQALEILIVDEVSMVRCDLMDSMDRFLRKNRGHEVPFGGVQVLLIGDLIQLPPVVPPYEREALKARGYATPFFFSARCLQEASLAPVELTHVFRQTDRHFVSLLDSLRMGEGLEAATGEINQHCFRAEASAADLTLTCTNHEADRINREALGGLDTREHLFQGVIEGKFSIEKDKLPSPMELRLKPGARVMFTRNDDQKRWVNGTLGVVRQAAEGRLQVELLHAGRGAVLDVQPVSWETIRYTYDETQDRIVSQMVGRYTQYPVMLAWAVTIHKSQGKTLDNVLVDLGSGAFASGQAYVALSRCRTLEGLRLARPIRQSDVTCDPRVKRFHAALAAMGGDGDEEKDMLSV